MEYINILNNAFYRAKCLRRGQEFEISSVVALRKIRKRLDIIKNFRIESGWMIGKELAMIDNVLKERGV